MPVTKLIEFLDGHQIKYVTIIHSSAFTAQEVAASAHIPGQQLAKAVMLKLDGKMAMAVLPAPKLVDFGLLKGTAGVQQAELANEREFGDMFPECEVGAMPPFGNFYDMQVYSDQSLTEDDEIAFNAGSHTMLINLPYKDFERLVSQKIARFSSAHA